MRKKWRVWCAWLKYVDQKYQNETPGLNEEVMRRRELSRMFHRTLQQLLPMQAFQGGSALYIEDTAGRAGLFSAQGVLARWAEYTQVRIAKRRILRLVHMLRGHRIKRAAFMCLKIGLRTSRLSKDEARQLGQSIDTDMRFVGDYVCVCVLCVTL